MKKEQDSYWFYKNEGTTDSETCPLFCIYNNIKIKFIN